MKSLARLIRFPNLLIIILTQVFLRYFIIKPVLHVQGVEPALSSFNFIILVLITLLIAAAGYIINDYFDIDSDRVNRPDKIVMGKWIRFETAKNIYYGINIIAGLLGFYLAWSVGALQLGLVFVLIMIMLWYYSSKYQTGILWGNLVVGLLSGFTVFIVWLFEFFALRNQPAAFLEAWPSSGVITWFVWGYFGFAFLTSIIRELIKDVQDMEGDKKVGFNTLPIVYGAKRSKLLIVSFTVLTLLAMAGAIYFLFLKEFGSAAWYLIATVQLLLIYLMIKTFSAKDKNDYKFLSNITKIIMVAGILSMQLIYLDL